ncbi:bifunctional DNA primase/polymerase [Streptomyces lunaelactis]|uniref:bifunctional DNA primase/polymerase n=1 Tax=Streptomyces lunaelactis TaxID=1535768 RepID=UPI00158483D8|nr:bifunctional DNA primase/polymerase [Streptomyces lunaelactis]NUK01996.1 bifunctional DNA primase/polymerase [Streptomyces lunaelactis]NUK18456.1 bifunctional DNA primase/polymerase [Streptomyces lunaelactis]
MSANLMSAALEATEHGWRVFPLRPGTKRPALHGEGSCPSTGVCEDGHRKWEQRATADPDRIRATWARGAFNVGIATGPSRLVVVDLDRPKPTDSADTPDGVTTFKALCERTGQAVPDTCRVRTASGGWHLYFTAPAGVRLTNTAGSLAPLVDTRAWGGYVVAAGSMMPTGAYAVADDAPCVDLPEWLLTLLQTPTPAPAKALTLPAVSGHRAALAALESECDNVRKAPEKQGNITLNRCAYKVGRFVAWGDIPRHVVEEAFQGAGEARGLTAAECRSTIRSALDSSIRKARPRDAA